MCLGPDLHGDRDDGLAMLLLAQLALCKCKGRGVAVTFDDAVSSVTLMNDLRLEAEEQPGNVKNLKRGSRARSRSTESTENRNDKSRTMLD